MATQTPNKGLILGIDLFTIAVSFFLAYFIRFNLTIKFDVSILILQVPLILAIGLTAFLITGTYKGVSTDTRFRDGYNIFKAIFLSSVFIILLTMINRFWGIHPDLSIPLSIIIIYGLLSFVGLTGFHYVFKVVYNAIVNTNLK